jgi:hypothetical protein
MIIWFILGWVVSWSLSLYLFIQAWRFSFDVTRGDLVCFIFLSGFPAISLFCATVVYWVERPSGTAIVVFKKKEF